MKRWGPTSTQSISERRGASPGDMSELNLDCIAGLHRSALVWLFSVKFNARNVCAHCSPLVPVQFSGSVMSDTLQPHGLQHASPPCPSPTPGVYSNSWPLSR